jgi:hypothetical protein
VIVAYNLAMRSYSERLICQKIQSKIATVGKEKERLFERPNLSGGKNFTVSSKALLEYDKLPVAHGLVVVGRRPTMPKNVAGSGKALFIANKLRDKQAKFVQKSVQSDMIMWFYLTSFPLFCLPQLMKRTGECRRYYHWSGSTQTARETIGRETLFENALKLTFERLKVV